MTYSVDPLLRAPLQRRYVTGNSKRANPYHDKGTGQFAHGPGGSSGLASGSDHVQWVDREFERLDGMHDINSLTDKPLSVICRKQGWGTPRTGSKADVDSAIRGGWIEAHRGVEDNWKTGKSAKDIMHAMHADPNYEHGTGIYGNGSYFSVNPAIAKHFAGKNGATVRVAINPKAKIVDYDQLKDEMADWRNANRFKVKDGTLYAMGADPGRYAAMRGYDVIRVVNHKDGGPVTKVTSIEDLLAPDPWGVTESHADQYVVLNRTAMLVEVEP